MCWPLSLVPLREHFLEVVPAFFVFRQICPIVCGGVVFAYVSFDIVSPSCLWSSLSSFCDVLDIGGRIPRCSCDCPFVTRIAGLMLCSLPFLTPLFCYPVFDAIVGHLAFCFVRASSYEVWP